MLFATHLGRVCPLNISTSLPLISMLAQGSATAACKIVCLLHWPVALDLRTSMTLDMTGDRGSPTRTISRMSVYFTDTGIFTMFKPRSIHHHPTEATKDDADARTEVTHMVCLHNFNLEKWARPLGTLNLPRRLLRKSAADKTEAPVSERVRLKLASST